MSSHPTNRIRRRRQKVKARYMKAREEVQLADIIETTPAGAIRRESVDPATQEEPIFMALDRQAIRQDWNTPALEKRRVVRRLIEGVLSPDQRPWAKILNVRALHVGDRREWERRRHANASS
jgi:hypothetical protein